MRRSAALIALLVISAVSFGIISGCRDDVLVEPPESLIGRYSGIYTLVEVENGIDTVDFRSQFIRFTFFSNSYQLRWDQGPTTAPADDTSSTNIRYFCGSDGDYTLESGVQFTVLDPSPIPAVCTQGDNPEGAFALNQQNPDTIFVIQVFINDDGNSETRTLRLVPEAL